MEAEVNSEMAYSVMFSFLTHDLSFCCPGIVMHSVETVPFSGNRSVDYAFRES